MTSSVSKIRSSDYSDLIFLHKHDQDNNSSDCEGIFSNVYHPFDPGFIDNNTLELDDMKMSHEADDVIFCDRMMTEAAIKVESKVEPRSCIDSINDISLFSDPGFTCASHDQSSLLLDNDDSHINEYESLIGGGSDHHYPYPSQSNPTRRTLPDLAMGRKVPIETVRRAIKRERLDSTDAMDHAPNFSSDAIDVAPYGRSITVRSFDQSPSESNGSGRLLRNIVRSNLSSSVDETADARRSVQYVVRQGIGGISPYLSNLSANNQLDSSNRQILPRNRCVNSSRTAKSEHANGGGKYTLYPPTPPSSTHCSSDSDDSSNCMMASSSSSFFRFRAQHQFQNSSISALSGELILTEEERRTFIAEGFPIPCKLPLTKQEERVMKKVRRKIKNKISAQESRRKKKEYLETLEKKIDQYSREYGEMKRRCESLESTNKSLAAQLRNLQAVLGRSSSTGTCLMVLVFCFTLLIGGGSHSVGFDAASGRGVAADADSSLASLRVLSRPSTLPAFWLPQWCPRLGYARIKHSFSHDEYDVPIRASMGAGGAVDELTEPLLRSAPPSRLLLGSEDEMWSDSVSVVASATCDLCQPPPTLQVLVLAAAAATQRLQFHQYQHATPLNVTF